jgi:hypothetical protein
MMPVYTSICPLTSLQQKIVRYIDYWVHTEKTPISQKRIIQEMESTSENKKTVIHALKGLLELRYIRKAVPPIGLTTNEKGSEKTRYVQLRGL